MPNGTAWTFTFDSGDPNINAAATGNLIKIDFPTGGYIKYGWTPIYVCQNPTSTTETTYTYAVSSRTVNANDGTGEHTTTYSFGNVSGSLSLNSSFSTSSTDALGNKIIHTITALGGICSFYETQTAFYDSANVLVKRISTAYHAEADPLTISDKDSANVFPISVSTTWANGQTTKIETDPDAGTPSTGRPSGFTILYGKPVAKREYDYGNPGVGPLLRATNTSYAWQSPNPNYASYRANNLLNAEASVQVCSPVGAGESADCGTLKQRAKTIFGYDGTAPLSSGVSLQLDPFPPSGSYRGNQTSIQRWLNSGTFTCPDGSSGGTSPYILSRTTFYNSGTVALEADPCGHGNTYQYSSNYYGAYPTTIANALGQQTTSSYDLNTGLVTSQSDQNQLVTSYSYDIMNRTIQVSAPDGGQTTYCYTDEGGSTCSQSASPYQLVTTKKISGSLTAQTTVTFDGLGRILRSQVDSDPQGTVYTDRAYDALGRIASVSNPYRAGSDSTSSPGNTSYTYDALGRKTQELYPDGSLLTTAYCGATTLVTDPTGRWRRSTVNALGQLVEVDEPNSSNATVLANGCPGTSDPVWVTSYTNDALGNLLKVIQNGSRQRTFTYDSLSRLLTAQNPESGTITYSYAPDSTLRTKQDARLITSTYTYDSLHRNTGVGYSNGDPSVSVAYDESSCLGLPACQNIGHQTSMTDAAGSESWSYQVDPSNLRNVHKEQRTINSSPSNVTKTTIYYSNLAGGVTQIVYPTGRTVNYTFDSVNHPTSSIDGANGITYVSGWNSPPAGSSCSSSAAFYTPQGSLYAMSIGQSSTFAGLNYLEAFNSRLQPLEIKASSSAGNALDLVYSFVDPVTNKNAGHVYSISNLINPDRTQTFTYDQVNRITSAGTNATTGNYCWGYQFSYDAWGNLLSQAGWTPNYNGCNQTVMASVTSDNGNHISAIGYDISGNALSDGINNYTWNAESQLKTAAGAIYDYDGAGRRVAKEGSKLYWYGSGGEILAETDAAGNTTNEYIFFGGRRVAMLPSGGTPLYYVGDSLGSARVVTQSDGTVCSDSEFVPFGGERAYINNCGQNYKFEGKERDTESGNDVFGARYYSWRFGRWLSADWSSVPVPVPYANLLNPQTLNLYSMVADDPESFADLDGHAQQTPNNGNPCNYPNQQQCANAQRKQAQSAEAALKSAGKTLLSSWLTVGSKIEKASEWTNEHSLIVFPIAITAALEGNEGPLEEGEAAIASAGEKISIQAEEVLTRFGTRAESTLEKLAADAAAAEKSPKVNNLHGVSAMANAVRPGGTALRSEVEKLFQVINTGKNPAHRTIVLPKPVTDAVVETFNKLFWP